MAGILVPILIALCAPAAPLPSASPAGLYRLTGEQDVASVLLLKQDGTFEYALAVGALDERATGRWTAGDGGTLRLETLPRPVPAVFSLADTGRAAAGTPLNVKVVWPDGRSIAGVDLLVGFDEGPPIDAYTQEDGWALDPAEHRSPRSIRLAVPMHGLVSPPFPIDAARGTELTFRLTPNDLGVLDFASIPVARTKEGLAVVRNGWTLRYVRAERGEH